MTTCPSEEALLAFSDRALDAHDAATVSTHVAGCSDCRMVLAELGKALTHDETGPGEPEPPRPLVRGSSLGGYLILEQVGAGGMGVVYAAYDAELDRRVALKLLRQRRGSDDQARLIREARAMARLNHPNVAAIYGVETSGDALFVSMEFIVGETVRRWAEREPRTLEQVLDVFLQAGRGLEAAHHAGLVHRDFKPDNMMVRPDGRVSVLDFGLSRAVGTSVASPGGELARSATTLTQTGTVLGTLRYMPPEQRLGKPADARADQYAFCVSLHETLYGAPPGEPPARRVAAVPAALQRAIARGLAEDPNDRHPDMHALLLVLERVRSPARRTWPAVVLAVLLAVAGSVVWQRRASAAACDGGADELAQAWPLDLAQGLTGARGAEVKAALDAYGAEWVAAHRQACEATRVHGGQSEELLDRRMLCLSARKAALGQTAALLASEGASLDRSAVVLAGLPRISDCADARGLLETVPPPGDPALRARLDETRQSLARVRALVDMYRPNDAVAASRAVVEEAEQLGYPPLLAEALLVRCSLIRLLGETLELEATAWRALFAAKEGRDAKLEAQAWLALADAQGLVLRRFAGAEWFFRGAEVSIRAVPDGELLEANRLRMYGQLHQLTGDLGTSIDAFQRSIALYEKRLPLPLPGPLALAYRRLSEALSSAQRYDEAEAAIRSAIRIAENDPTGSSALDRCVTTLGDILRRRRRFDEAREWMLRALDQARQSGTTFTIMPALESLGRLEHDAGRDAEAEKWFAQMVAITEPLPEPNPYLAMARGQLGMVLLSTGDVGEAERLLRKAVEGYERFGAKGDHETMQVRTALARLLVKTGQRAEAASNLAVLVGYLDADPASPVALAGMRFDLATVLWDAGQREKARALAVAARDPSLGALRADIEQWLAAHR